jgi:dinuclear metal center YbgI/SA1388 family protein
LGAGGRRRRLPRPPRRDWPRRQLSPATVSRAELAAYLDEYLEVAGQQDYGPNGLQVEGRSEVGRLATGVSACRELHEAAVAWGADAVLVHHGLFWRFLPPPTLTGYLYQRVAPLVRHGVNLFAYHLPLDRHPVLGNNALIADHLGVADRQPFAVYEGQPIGWSGRLAAPLTLDQLRTRCHELFGQEPLALGGGPTSVRTVGIVSGGAPRELYQAIAAGLDAYLTGEASEWVTNVAREAGIHYLACGHHATERLGVRKLGEHLAQRFGIEARFIDVPNPV